MMWFTEHSVLRLSQNSQNSQNLSKMIERSVTLKICHMIILGYLNCCVVVVLRHIIRFILWQCLCIRPLVDSMVRLDRCLLRYFTCLFFCLIPFLWFKFHLSSVALSVLFHRAKDLLVAVCVNLFFFRYKCHLATVTAVVGDSGGVLLRPCTRSYIVKVTCIDVMS